MKTAIVIVLAVIAIGTALAQPSDDPDVQRLDSLKTQLDSMATPDTPALLRAVDSLSASGETPKDFPQILQLGKVDLSEGRVAEALAEFDKAVQLVPEDARALSLKGKTLTMLGRGSEALPSLNKAIELEPGLADAHYNRAGAYNIMSHPELALADLQAAIDADTTLKSLARNSTWFQSLHDNPTFLKLVK
jgi:Flp pilus assembly protein TadD